MDYLHFVQVCRIVPNNIIYIENSSWIFLWL